MSFGTLNSSYDEGKVLDPVTSALMKKIRDNGGVLFGAAGNLNSKLDPNKQIWPAADPNVEGVGGPFIVYNPKTDSYYVDMKLLEYQYSLAGAMLGTNGFQILSTGNNEYVRMTGTSMSTPVATIITANLMRAFPERTIQEILNTLYQTGAPVKNAPNMRFMNPFEAINKLIIDSNDPRLIQFLSSHHQYMPFVSLN